MKKNRVPDILVEQLLLGELPEARRAELLADPDVQARMQELQASNREILERYPPEVYGKRIGWRLEKGQAGRRERSRRMSSTASGASTSVGSVSSRSKTRSPEAIADWNWL